MPEIDLCVALTGFAGLDEPGPGASVARALREGWQGKLRLIALDDDRFMTGAWRPGLVDRLQQLPPCRAGEDQWLRAIGQAHEESRFDVLIPGSDRDALVAASMRERLDRLGIRTLLPGVERLEAIRPDRLPRFLSDNDIHGPMTVIVSDPADVARQADQVGYPLFVRIPGRAARLVYNAGQALLASAADPLAANKQIVLQRQPLGEAYRVALVADAAGGCAGMVVMRSVALNAEGRIVSGTVVDEPEVADFALEVLDALDWRGPLELEIYRPTGYKGLWLSDLHAHLPSWSMLCHWAGANLAVLLLKQVLSSPTKPGSRARPGTMYVRSVSETAVPLEDLTKLGRRRGVIGRPVSNGNGAAPAEASHGLRIALTGVSTYDVINPGLGVARALRQAPGVSKIYGLAYGTFDSGAYQSELFDRVFQLPGKDDKQRLLKRLTEIHEAQPFDVLIPCLDGELPRFIAIADELRKLGINTLLPSKRSLERRSKSHIFGGKIAADWGAFQVPKSLVAKSEKAAIKAVRSLGFPAVIKGPVWQCIPVASESDAKWAWQQLVACGAESAIAQPCVSGQSFAVSVVCDKDHQVLSSLTVKKLALCGRGSTWSAVRVEQPALEAAFADFLASIAWVGPAEGEFIRDEVTDMFHLIEVNPRFTGWIYYSAALGANQPYLAARVAMGERVNPQPNDQSVVFMRADDEVALRPAAIASLATKGVLSHV